MLGRWRKGNEPGNGSMDGCYRNGNRYLIECRDLVKCYQTPAGEFPALKSIDVQIDRGEFVAVVGKSGSGKSTLINMITGIDRPTSGRVLVGDAAVETLKEGKLAEWRGRNIGVIFQFFQLLPTLSVVENVMLPMDFCHMYSGRERLERAMHLLDQVEVADHAYKLPSAISGGQQQRVAIARALANDPPILAADEPTGNLDSKTAESVFGLFQDLVDQGKTILMVTHDQDLAAKASRIIILADGEIIEESLTRAFPTLSEEQLIQATRGVQPRSYLPGSAILEEGEPANGFYIILRGQVEAVVPGPHGKDAVCATMGRGEYFGEIELLQGGDNRATVRAASDTRVEVAVLDRDSFFQVVAESDQSREQIDLVAQARIVQNSASRRGNGHA